MGKLFGTDGIRGIANLELTPELAYKVGRAAGYVLSKNQNGKMLIGRDTRLSGHLIESALAAGLMSIGIDVEIAGVIPTPAIAYLTRTGDYLAGVVISASHNPFEHNGIKFFSSDGYKLPDKVEYQIEDLIFSDTKIYKNATGDDVGTVIYSYELQDRYHDYLLGLSDLNLKGVKVALDLGNGALYKLAPKVLKDLGAEVVVINDEPDGTNINKNSGSTNPELISKLVVKEKADIGMSFDGDADRIIAVDENGDIIDGDHILAICATQLKKEDKLTNNTVVGTIMSNIGLKRYLSDIGVDLVYTQVGDRYVLEEMEKNDFVLGGEQSGHIIFLDYNTTGDGLATGIHLLEVMEKTGKKMSELNNLMKSYPQVLVNAKVRSDLKNKYMDFEDIREKIENIEKKFKGNGRVVIRPSGTESLVRVMIEGEDETVLQREAEELAEFIEKKLS
ncbi:phosphoglucosamine mutase [Anaerosphaera multitolerans]|uniref:Phosphoglucosamine mutase n=1 Tax=Anaerosphaera multitolerans TaxID=2487351 RepID=A0A437S4H0_9FIRM|nr:phosphoglucosamine mutase [Anaerosphaera multitolerans]RVU53913.1 phosphoglucosamine mutase [Anaerosphaera multitolerans]